MPEGKGKRGLTIQQLAELGTSGDPERLLGETVFVWQTLEGAWSQQAVVIGPRIVVGENYQLTYPGGHVSNMLWPYPVFVPIEELSFGEDKIQHGRK